MTRQVPMDRPLSTEDRAYLLMRGEDSRVAQMDAAFPEEADTEPDDGAEVEDAGGAGSDLPDDYAKWPKAELEAEVKARNDSGAGIEVTGTGRNGAVLVADLAKALQDDDNKS